MRNVDNFFGIVGKAGKVSHDGAVGRLWQHEKCGSFGIVGKISNDGAVG